MDNSVYKFRAEKRIYKNNKIRAACKGSISKNCPWVKIVPTALCPAQLQAMYQDPRNYFFFPCAIICGSHPASDYANCI